jgi:S1-C subfamily serine protease
MAIHNVLSTLSSDLAVIVDRASAQVVGVDARPRRPASGLALGGDLVITADHAIERDTGIGVTRDGVRYDATLVGRDSATDLALLRVTGLSAPQPETAPPGKAGSLVLSIARTSAGTVSVALGVITSIGGPLRSPRGIALPQIIRTDAAMRPGTAGGVIVDTEGRVLGITTPALLRGLPVAIPIEHAKSIAERLASGQGAARGYLGVSVHAVRLPARQRTGDGDRGLLIAGVAADTAADRAGLLVGDILVRVGDRQLSSVEDLQDAMADTPPERVLALEVLRGGAPQRLDVTVGARTQP